MVYCDDSEMVIEDAEDKFGTAIDGWDLNHEDTDPIFVRNYQLECDYEINKMFCQSPQFMRIDGEGFAE
jgi:hypothetical protein